MNSSETCVQYSKRICLSIHISHFKHTFLCQQGQTAHGSEVTQHPFVNTRRWQKNNEEKNCYTRDWLIEWRKNRITSIKNVRLYNCLFLGVCRRLKWFLIYSGIDNFNVARYGAGLANKNKNICLKNSMIVLIFWLLRHRRLVFKPHLPFFRLVLSKNRYFFPSSDALDPIWICWGQISPDKLVIEPYRLKPCNLRRTDA